MLYSIYLYSIQHRVEYNKNDEKINSYYENII